MADSTNAGHESQIDIGGVHLLGNGSGPPPRKCSGSLPGFMKGFKMSPAYGGKTDYIEIEGMESIEGLSADWSDALLSRGGVLCPSAPLFFNVNNSCGSTPWPAAARGAIVVCIRGVISFDEMTHNAAEAGALALIIVDNEPKWRNNWLMTNDTLEAPTIPAVLVSHKHAQFMCSEGNGVRAAITRRASKLGTTTIATNFLKSALPF